MIQSEYEAPCRFYGGDKRPTRIKYFFAAPGALPCFFPSPFHAAGNYHQQRPVLLAEAGELTGQPRDYTVRGRPPWLNGTHGPDGTERDFAGQSPIPGGLLGDGRLPAESRTACNSPPGWRLKFCNLLDAVATLDLVVDGGLGISDSTGRLALRAYQIAVDYAPSFLRCHYSFFSGENVPGIVVEGFDLAPTLPATTVVQVVEDDGYTLTPGAAGVAILGFRPATAGLKGSLVPGAQTLLGPKTIEVPPSGAVPAGVLILSNPAVATAPVNQAAPALIQQGSVWDDGAGLARPYQARWEARPIDGTNGLTKMFLVLGTGAVPPDVLAIDSAGNVAAAGFAGALSGSGAGITGLVAAQVAGVATAAGVAASLAALAPIAASGSSADASYNHAASHLTAANAQTAIDELAARLFVFDEAVTIWTGTQAFNVSVANDVYWNSGIALTLPAGLWEVVADVRWQMSALTGGLLYLVGELFDEGPVGASISGTARIFVLEQNPPLNALRGGTGRLSTRILSNGANRVAIRVKRGGALTWASTSIEGDGNGLTMIRAERVPIAP